MARVTSPSFLAPERLRARRSTHYGRPAHTRRYGRLFHHSTSSGAGLRDRDGVVALPAGDLEHESDPED